MALHARGASAEELLQKGPWGGAQALTEAGTHGDRTPTGLQGGSEPTALSSSKTE